MGRYHHWAAALALAATGAAVPAQAQDRCWSEREVAAAQVREMQTMLMVAALRCRAVNIDISADYNGFVATQRAALERANLVIKQHFAAVGGQQADYDRFATSLANGFGDGQTNESSCAEAAALAHDGAAATADAVEALAMARVFPTALPDGRCAAPAGGVTLAVAGPAAAAAAAGRDVLPVLLALAPPPADAPAATPVTLPADVVAAMTVLARFQASQPAAMPATPTQLAAVAR